MTLQNQLYVVVRGKDSLIDLPLTEDGALVSSDGITRCDLVFRREGVASVAFSSSSSQASWFVLQQDTVLDGVAVKVVRVNLRQIPATPVDGRYKVDVFLWDADFTNGRLWATLDVEVRAAPPVPA